MRSNPAGLVSIFIALVLGGCSARSEAPGEAPQHVETLSFSVKTTSQLTGTYVYGGTTIGFNVRSSPRQISITDSSGSPIISTTGDTAAGTATTQLYGGAYTINSITNSDGTHTGTTSGDSTQVTRFFESAEAGAIVPFSNALGSQGIDGSSYPCSYIVHFLAEIVGTGLSLAPPANRVDRRGEVLTDRAVACADLSNDPNGDGCFGMCGPGCTCWVHVCGNCCWNKGCARHDAACGACGWSNWGACILCWTFDGGAPVILECGSGS